MSEILSDKEKERLAERIAKTAETKLFRPGKFDLQKKDLPFYNGAFDVQIKCFTTHPIITKEYICTEKDVFETDGSFESIDEINEALGLILNDKTIADYVDFYFGKVSFNGEFFSLISKPSDLFKFDSFPQTLKENLQKLICPPRIRKEEDGFVLTGFILYETTLFKADVIVSETGEIDIGDEEIVYEDLPVKRVMLR